MVTEAISPEFLSKLEARGVSRRSFMKLCGSLLALLRRSRTPLSAQNQVLCIP
mgnify:CR=1 FL=1